ncbi:MAG TPA: asparagine synthase-related protein [Alphaproteobacteria bacterium]|nr:asparagine synthase-related protein [Alphaproteobacteria bacterium]
MIYVGLLCLNSTSDKTAELTDALQSFSQTPPLVIKKESLILCYGKLSNILDLDEVWENESSVLIGRVFDRAKQCSLRKKDFKNLTDLPKEKALENVWGKYVYIHENKQSSRFEVVLDSTGQLPFFYYPLLDGSILFSSNIEIIFKALSQKPEFNWTYLCSYLIYGNSSSIETPFKNIYELPPACSLAITKNERKTAPFWNPLHSYKNPDIKGRNAVDVLNATLNPWIEPYQNIYVSLSGGLDSSSLLYCLKDLVKEDQALKAINYFHSQVKSSNEYDHARKVCEETGVELIGIDVSNSLPFDPSQYKEPLKPNKPFPEFISTRWAETIFEHLPAHQSFTFVSGHGSDHIFMRPPSKRSVSDYILEQGFKESKRQFQGIAQFYRDPLLSILKENFKSLLTHSLGIKKERRKIREKHKNMPAWVKQEVMQIASSSISHPIYNYLSKKILPGKYHQLDLLYEGLASIHIEIMNQSDPTYFPFFYEPVVEFALSFPTYELFKKGYDRYPLRKAISDHFKTETVWRRDKSQTTGLIQLGIKKNLKDILEISCEGHFVKQGLIEKEGLHRTITLIGNGDTNFMWPFTHLVSLEMFLRYWDEL